jgi:hypothetical protein
MTFSDNRPTDLPSSLANAPIAARPNGALANTDQQRAIAEVQAAMIIARSNPRDVLRAIDLIVQDCTRPGLAEKALYQYARGGTDITGPSIRLAECLAIRYGNLQYGIRELEQRQGESVLQAFCWDVEANVRREVVFTAPHVRDTKRGRTNLTDARDIYEATANVGARRLRACILGVIPGDVVDAAVDQVEKTLHTKADVTPERIKKMVEAFGAYGVTKGQIETRIQRRLDAITPALFVQLTKIYNSLKDGMSAAADWFEAEPTNGAAEPAKPAAGVAGLKDRIKGAAAKTQEPAKPEPPATMPASDDIFGGREPGSEG